MLTTATIPFFQADQLVVQGMMASRYLAQFEEVVSGWQTQLSMVRYDVVQSVAHLPRGFEVVGLGPGPSTGSAAVWPVQKN